MHAAVAWPHLTIVAVLDILVVAFIIYQLLRRSAAPAQRSFWWALR
jgi:hypothetical protein